LSRCPHFDAPSAVATPLPIGNVQRLSLAASQFAVMIGELLT
jgi:hypothetical protein